MGFLIIVCDGGGVGIFLVMESPNKKGGVRTSFNESKSKTNKWIGFNKFG